jgi:hypothetical protein
MKKDHSRSTPILRATHGRASAKEGRGIGRSFNFWTREAAICYLEL